MLKLKYLLGGNRMYNHNKSQAIIFLVLGIAFLFIGVGIVFILHSLVLPNLEKYFEEELNMIVMIGLTAVIPAYLVKCFFTYSAIKVRPFVMNIRYDIIDGMIPLFSEFKLKPLYLSMVTETYIEDSNGNFIDGISSSKRFWVKNLCNINIIISIFFYIDLIGVGVYFYLTNNMFMMTINHIAWLVSLLLLYNLGVTVRSIMFGITYKSMEDWIFSRNPIWFIVLPFVIPCISIGYLLLIFIGGWIFNMSVSQPFFNIISLFGVPIFNPIICAVHAKLAVNESKRTVDQTRREQGYPPQIW